MIKDSQKNLAIEQNQQANKMFEAAKKFEQSRIDMVKRSNKIAWGISGISLVMTAAAIGAVFILTPLKTVEPYVIQVDKTTGQTDIIYALKEKQISKDEAMDRYWLKNYVIFRESYDWYNVQTNYDTTMMFSGDNERRQIAAFFDSNNAPYKVFKNDYRIDIKITAISYVGDLAQVRFERKMRDLRDTSKEPVTQKLIATIGYEYIGTKVPQDERLINPLGFKVGSYKVDVEN